MKIQEFLESADQFEEGGTSRRDLGGCGKWKNLSASALIKPGAHMQIKKFHFKCTKLF